MGDTVTIGIDIGTTSVKAVAAAADGTVLARARVPHELHNPDADTFEHDARAAWVDGVVEAYETVAEGLDPSGAVVSAMVPSLCAVDDDGVPIGAGLLYGDARGRTEFGTDSVAGEVVGFAHALAADTPSARFWPAQAVANHALCGVGGIDTSTAMTMTPLFTGTGWDQQHLDAIGITADQLPTLVPGTDPLGTRGSTTFGGGTIDALAEQMVGDATEPGDVMLICGTTLIPWALTTEWCEVDGLWTIPYSVPGIIAIGGASNAGGLFIDHIRRLTGDPAPRDVLAVPPEARPIWMPYIRGERTPFHDPTKRARLLDTDTMHDSATVLAAAYDASAMVVRHHLDLARPALDAAATPPTRIVAAGGGTRSEPWMQALADVTGLPVDVSRHAEGAALGAARTARDVAGLVTEAEWRTISHRVLPRPDHQVHAEARYVTFREEAER
ncbi:MAG: FGGY-family carbohydrate kinase [Actinomycetota bacterium]